MTAVVTAVAVTAFVTATAFTAAAEATAAAKATVFAAEAAAFIAAALAATLAAFIAATLAAFVTAAFTVAAYLMAASIFKDEAVRAFRNRDQDAVTTLEFIPSWAFRGRSRNAGVATHFISPRAMWWRNHTAVTSVEYITGWAFRTVLVVAGATTPVFAIAAVGQCQRAARTQHEKAHCENCSQALPHEKSLVL